MRGVRALDKAMLDACTRMSHYVQRRTGLTNFFIAKCLGALAAGVALLDLIADYAVPRTTEDYVGGPTVLNDAILLVYLGYMLIIRPEHLEERFLVDPSLLPKQYLIDGEPCRWRPILFSAAIFFPLAFSFVGKPVWMIVRSTGAFWCLLSLYFMAVMPLPPGQTHIKEDVPGPTAAMEASVATGKG